MSCRRLVTCIARLEVEQVLEPVSKDSIDIVGISSICGREMVNPPSLPFGGVEEGDDVLQLLSDSLVDSVDLRIQGKISVIQVFIDDRLYFVRQPIAGGEEAL